MMRKIYWIPVSTGMTAKNLVIPAWDFGKVPSNLLFLLKLFQSLTFPKLEGWNPEKI
jgi:hypothetical protein